MEKHLSANFITNILVFVLSSTIGIFLTPFLLRYLNTDGFGVIKLAMNIPMIISLFTLILTAGVSRFLTINLQQNNIIEANNTFNSFFWGLNFIVLLLIPLITYLTFNLNIYLDIPENFEDSALYLFLGVILSSLFGIYSSVFFTPAFSINRLDIINYSKILGLVLLNGLIIILLVNFNNHMISIGFAYFISAFSGLVLSIYVCKKFSPDLFINIKYVTKKKLVELANFGKWIILDHLGTMLFIYLDLIIINILLGSLATGEYSIPLQWQILLKSFIMIFASIIIPLIYFNYSHENYYKLRIISKLSIKYLSIIISIPIALLCVFGEEFFKLWIGDEYTVLIPLLWIMIIPQFFNLPVTILFTVNSAYNSVKTPAIATIVFGLLHLIIGILLIKYYNLGIYGLAISSAIFFTIRNFIFIIFYTNSLLKDDLRSYYYNYIYGAVNFIVIVILGLLSTNYFEIGTWLFLIINVFVTLLLSILFIYLILLNSDECKYLNNNFLKKLILKRGK